MSGMLLRAGSRNQRVWGDLGRGVFIGFLGRFCNSLWIFFISLCGLCSSLRIVSIVQLVQDSIHLTTYTHAQQPNSLYPQPCPNSLPSMPT